uniref:Transporter n=1 Tax=Cacopsylla melanoneura TaxID=428564 RepID=A0A8D8MEV7_9HEMI
MANTAHLVRRQSSRDLQPNQRTLDSVELKSLKTKMLLENGGMKSQSYPQGQSFKQYGATNRGFDESVVTKQTSVLSPNALEIPIPEDSKPGVFKASDGGDTEEREAWDSKLTFLLATIGYAVGLGNVWRFPYLAQKNGGGAFLIPYFIMLAIEGLPIFYLELAIGQRLRKGAIGVWNHVSPYLVGIGIASAVVSFNVALYYNTVIAWCLLYFLQSFQPQLPWAQCPTRDYPNGTSAIEPECLVSTPTEYFWYRSTLNISPSIDDPVSFNWQIAFALVMAWTVVYLCMRQGIASSPFVVYITSMFPYVVLIIFFIRGITLPGMSHGLSHLFTPKWYMLKEPRVWLEAGTQIFFSLGLAFGGLIAYSSYNPVDNNCYRDAFIVSLTNCCTSMFAAIVIFAIIGFKATSTYENCLKTQSAMLALDPHDSHNLPECSLQKELENTASGTGLAFIIFTEAINQFPGAQIWAVLFFLMLFTLGIDSQFGTLEGVTTSIVDMKIFPNLKKEVITGILCCICCVISMSFAHGAGNYVFILFDSYSGNFPLLIIAFFECIAVAYIYGLKRFADDIEMMTGSRPNLYWLLCWKYISPAVMLVIFTSSLMDLFLGQAGYAAWNAEKGITETKEWPTWALLMIAFLIFVSVLWIPLVAILRVLGVVLIDDSASAVWFPSADLKKFHGIPAHRSPTAVEKILFCIQDDGSEGLCCPTAPCRDDEEEPLDEHHK